MSTDETEHRIYPHGMPEQVAPNLWRVVGSLPLPLLKRNMFIFRLPDGGLLLHSVIAMEEPGMRALEALGAPRAMVVPHPKHTMDAKFYKARYPQIRVFGAADAQAKLKDLPFDATPAAGLGPFGIRARAVPGMKITEIVLELPLEGGSGLLFTDLVNQNEDAGLLMKVLGPPGGGGVARVLKLTQIDDTEQVRHFLEELAQIPSIQLIAGCHGNVVTQRCNQWLAHAAAAM